MSQIYEKYKKAYQHYSGIYGADTAVFYLVGKFYEMYDWIDTKTGLPGTSMKRVADLLGIQMTTKKGNAPGGADGFFAGVPEQSLHKFAGILTRLNWTVVIYDQVKDSKGAIKERVPGRILTPGTHVEMATHDAVYIAGIWLEEAKWGSRAAPAFGLVVLDLTTGCITTYEGTAAGKDTQWSADDALHFFQVHPPRECFVWWKGASVACPDAGVLQRQFGLLGCKIHTEVGTEDLPLMREEFLRSAIPLRSLLPLRDALQIALTPRVELALCALLRRLDNMYPSGADARGLHCPVRWNPSTSLFLGNQALLQLNMITPQMEDSILGLFQHTQTTFGRRAMRNRILFPVADLQTLETRYSEIEFMGSLSSDTAEKLGRHLQTIGDLPRLHRRITAAQTTAADICILDMSYMCVERIMEIFQGTCLSGPGLPPMHLNSVFNIAAAKSPSEDTFCFQRGRATAVDAIEDKIQDAHRILQNCLEGISKWAGLQSDSLRMEFREVHGPGISGTKASMATVARALKAGGPQPYSGIHIQQKKSSSSVEIPILQKTWSQILALRGELQQAVRTALPPLANELTDANLEAWDLLEEWVARIDITYTLWKVCKQHRFTRPRLVNHEHGTICATGLRHPLIEATVTRTEYVPHDVTLNSTGWLIYGMNASGKSSLMKAVGIATILAQAGCYVPATSFEFTPFRSLFTRILNTDNLWAGLSSFAVEMTELREILQRADKWSLVLGDEVCSGTESVSATSLVAASIRHLCEQRVAYIFATHLHGLVPFVDKCTRLSIWHLKVRYDPVADRLIYERTLTPGPGSSLYGLEVARAMNLPEKLLQEATKIRRELLGEGSAKSSWNGAVERRVCEICQHSILKDLEVHHIRARREADADGYFSDGSHQDDVRNLIVVCEACHDKAHAGAVTISPVVQTSDGPMRIATTGAAGTAKKSKWSEEQITVIRKYLTEFPNCPPKRAVFDLNEMGISISAASLKTFRNTV